jgi:NADH-quinone oxidoreductase subunit H
MFFLGEYSNIFALSALNTILFLGGWLPLFWSFPFTLINPMIWYSIKILSVAYLYILIRALLPRYRYDQLMRLGWKVFLPFGLAWVLFISSIFICCGFLPVNITPSIF